MYSGCPEVIFTHPTLTAGSTCPHCAEANTNSKLQNDNPKVLVRLVGTPLITGTRYTAKCLTCKTCDSRFQAQFPEAIKNTPKYDVSCTTSLAISRYFLGMPMYRTEKNQDMHGIPMKDATQYDLLWRAHDLIKPAHEALITLSANGELMIYDDTTGRIVENKTNNTPTHTTAFISVYEGHKIHLFFTGSNHAGNNVDVILANRTTEKPVIAMMDASPSNIPKNMGRELTARFILCFCLVHGRRKFFEVFNFFDKECNFVLDVIGIVYAHDAHCKKEKLSAENRLIYHQTNSKPLMDSLYIWLNNQLLYDLCEDNGGLGKAVKYMLRHRLALTTFLRVAGAPLDSSWAERAIKIAIRHRRNSLFYKTSKGAMVGDCFMSLIYTCQQNSINPYEYLNALQRYPCEVKANPALWLPWNYLKTQEELMLKIVA